MSRTKNLFEEVVAKAEQEYSSFLEGLKGQGFEETISRVYEILTKRELLDILRDDYSGADYIGLQNTDMPLDTLYQDWLKKDGDYRCLLEESAVHYLSQAAMKFEGQRKGKAGRNAGMHILCRKDDADSRKERNRLGYCTREQIEAARAMDILTYLRLYEPGNLKPFGRDGYCLKDHDSLKISNGKWYWWSRGIGGKTALDYLVSVRNVPFTKAVEMLCSGNIKAAYPVPKPRDRPKPAFVPPERNKNNCQVISYLMKRGIDREIIDYCMDNGLLYEDRQYHNAVFAGYNAERQMKYAFKRSTYANSTFMGEVDGSDKRYSFSILPDGAGEKLAAIFESAIDALSYATLLKMDGLDWKSCRYLSLGGVYQEGHGTPALSPALAAYLERNLQAQTLLLCLDSDAVGRQAAAGILAALEGTQIVCVSQPPKGAKDYNELLMERKGLKSTVKTRGAKCGEPAR